MHKHCLIHEHYTYKLYCIKGEFLNANNAWKLFFTHRIFSVKTVYLFVITRCSAV